MPLKDPNKRRAYKARMYAAEPRKEVIYVLIHPAFAGYLKVGQTTIADRRLQVFNIGDPLRRYEYAAKFAVTDAVRAEVDAHELLRDARVGATEWYRMTVDDAIAAILTLPQVIEMEAA